MPEKRRSSSPAPGGERQSHLAETRSVEAVWRQALLLKEILRDEKTEAHKRRGEAEEARRSAERDAIGATEAVCQKMRAEAEDELGSARDALEEAEKVRDESLSDAERVRQDAASELFVAKKVRTEAEEYSTRLEASARQKAEATLADSRRSAEKIRDEMREQTADEIRELMEDIDAVRAATSEELETQRILTEAARIRALSPGLALGMADEGAAEDREAIAQVSDQADAGDRGGEPDASVVPPVKPRSQSSTSKTAAKRRAA